MDPRIREDDELASSIMVKSFFNPMYHEDTKAQRKSKALNPE